MPTSRSFPPAPPLDLVRDPGNDADPNAVQIQHQGVSLGWIAREIARPLALALDEDPAPHIYAQLATDAHSIAQQNGADQLHVHNAVILTIMLAHGDHPHRPT
ncbi:HIRAN domain-containing protein [Streptomyces sp. NPDC058439]|uniref:HIRAN domain-containing protein n=1 Tax=Streptomyces sp. NPDC058439 TaxID=3346500 RepID=UPI003651A45D